MRFPLDEQGVRWFLDASAYTGFHKTLAQKIIPHLELSDTLYDVGCGLGRLDLELAPFVSELTSVDLNENSVAVLRNDARTLGLHNVRAGISDAYTLSQDYDVILLSFFGQSNTLCFQPFCRRKLIRIVNAENKSGLYPSRYRCTVKDTVPDVEKQLCSKGVDYKLESYTIEFGQPLRSWRDAELYILKNAPEASASEVGAFLDERLTNTNNDDFPYYLPNPKELGIFIIAKET